MRATVPESTNVCQDDQICDGLKARILLGLHEVQTIWDQDLTTENRKFLLVDARNAFNMINRVGMLWTVRHLWPSKALFSLISVVTGDRLSYITKLEWPVFCIVKKA